ncbi:L,D-transpeptidase family protein [Mycobacterium frederiksbergense]|uniref:L,D-transpeptidase n=2 Tax=Mycobacteriaceae TaxID=1762 RepID=UPI0021F328C5|nr:L,D-transpeptidase family protein [Mycolicibacterium frederiksbergense]MCV7045526.1 L,D-transpeptidase family protein [Mycolicibacterium frederiksbergense]
MTRRATVWAALSAVAVVGFSATLPAVPSASAEPSAPDSPDPAWPGLTVDPMTDRTTAADQSVLPSPSGEPPGPSTVPATAASGTPAGQNPNPYSGPPVFAPPTFNPVNGSMVGVAKPIIINFQRPIADRPMAEQAIHISSTPAVPGKFYWMSDSQVRWRPIDFWPANTTVTIDASGTKSSFRTGESLVATIDDATHQMTVSRNGVIEKTFPVSLGKAKYETKNGTYYVLEKFADIVMDSSTYGVPIDSPEGYKLKVQDAVRIDNSGIFVHGAPWSVGDQGKRNVSHGCINLSPANAQWFYDNFGSGDPVVIKNTTGGLYDQPDGAQDWQI